MKLKHAFIVRTTTSLYGVLIPKWKHTPGNPSPGFLLRVSCTVSKRLSSPGCPLAWDGGVITSFGDGMKALYKESKWNALLLMELPIKKQHLERSGSAKTGLSPMTRLKPVGPLLQRGPKRMFFFPSFHPLLLMSLFVKSCRQCTFTLAHIAHKSPKADVPLNILIKLISCVEHMAWLQCKPAQGTLLKKKIVVILSSTQSTLH